MPNFSVRMEKLKHLNSASSAEKLVICQGFVLKEVVEEAGVVAEAVAVGAMVVSNVGSQDTSPENVLRVVEAEEVGSEVEAVGEGVGEEEAGSRF